MLDLGLLLILHLRVIRSQLLSPGRGRKLIDHHPSLCSLEPPHLPAELHAPGHPAANEVCVPVEDFPVAACIFACEGRRRRLVMSDTEAILFAKKLTGLIRHLDEVATSLVVAFLDFAHVGCCSCRWCWSLRKLRGGCVAADAANGQRILGGNCCLFEYTRQFRVTY